MRTTHILGILVLLALALPAAPAHAGGVVSVCDEAHLRAALAGGGTVTFACSGTITLSAEIVISADTTIDGNGQAVTISGNNAVRVFKVNSGVTLNLNGLTVADGSARNSGGGGIYNNGILNVSDSTLSGNSAQGDGDAGGGILSSYGAVTVSNSAFSGNSADVGGGIYNSEGAVTVSNSTFSGNSGTYGGGGIYSGVGCTLIVSTSTFSHNNTGGGGGGIGSDFGTVTVTNSTFSGNNAGYDGGGIRNVGALIVNNSTFSDNGAFAIGGGIAVSGTATLKNTIVANNPTGGNCSGTITDGGGNLSYPDTTCPGVNSDPKLGPLQNNGGPTWTMDLGSGSAAFEAGDNTTCAAAPVNNLDQRGVPRPQGARCDIGAVEHQLPFWKWFPAASVR